MSKVLTTTTPADLVIRCSASADNAAILALYPWAFPGEDLSPLVDALLAQPQGVLSLVAEQGSDIIGHIAFTFCQLDDMALKPALLGPLAVTPSWQRKGVGTALIRAGLDRVHATGRDITLVLGDPAYYARHGFAREIDINPPYDLAPQWGGAWQSIRTNDARARGRLAVPDIWAKPALWQP